MADEGNVSDGKYFISSWPPESPGNSEASPRKRTKYDEDKGSVSKHVYTVQLAKNNQDTGDEGTKPRDTADTEPLEANRMYDTEDCMSWALPALARWWKKKQKSLDISLGWKFPDSNNAKTVLHHVSRLPEAKQFMMAQVKQLQKQVPSKLGCVGIHVTLASYYSKMRDLTKAEEYLDNAHKLDPGNKDILWMQAKVKRNKNLQEQTQKHRELTSLPKAKDLQMKEPLEVERRHHSSLDAKEFLYKYALTGTPVIITGLVEHMTDEPWTIQYIKKVIGHKNVPLKKRVEESAEWAKLENYGTMSVESFINSLHDDKKLRCLFDWSLSTFGPKLAKEITIPRYFASDFLQRTESGSMYRDSWPSLFIAPEGMITDLHVDSFGSNFWMALFEGRKRWTFFRKEDLPCLYPYCDQDFNIVFDVDFSRPDLKDFPLLSTVTPIVCVLEAGELLFVPHGSPHYVETLEDSLAVSANFIDLSNYDSALEELNIMGIIDPQAESLYKQLSSVKFLTKMWSEQKDLKWEQFKEWPRDDYEIYDIDLGKLP